ncbi:MAG TPA: TRAP transporter small permease subunit [Caldimonas sp.]|nr:TRAP transporter small permease subunit [Caldimonas sp.]
MPDRQRLRRLVLALSAALDRGTRAGAWLVLPLAVLLFAQWPLRDAVGAWSRQANDIAQWIFAIYVALALRAATRARQHMAAGLFVARYAPRWRRRLGRYGEAILVLPWALFVLVSGAAPTWRSLAGFEAFPDTYNPLYFVIRISAWLLALLMSMQAIVEIGGGGTQLSSDARPEATPAPLP